MKRTLLLLLAVVALTMQVEALTHIYRGRSTYTSDIIATWDGKYIYQGRSTYMSDIIATVTGQHVYQGRSTYSSDILYTISGHLPVPLLIVL